MSQENEARRYSRRSFNSGLFKVAGALVALGVLKMGHIPNPGREGPEYSDIIPSVFENLMELDFQTIAHNGGNAPDHHEIYSQTNCDFIEIDVFSRDGKVYVGHPEKHAGLSIDTSKRSIGLESYSQKFSSVAREVARNGKKLFVDFKDSRSVGPVFDFLSREQLLGSASFTSTGWEDLIEIRDRQGGKCDNLFFTIQNEPGFEAFLGYDKFPRAPFGVSLDKELASAENIRRLKELGAKVFVYTVKSPEGALEFISNGADGITTNNISLMNIKPLHA